MGLAELIGISLLLLGGYLLYAYITFYEEKEKNIKNFFQIKKKSKELVFSIITIIIATTAGWFGRSLNDYSAVMCYLNICMIMLLAAMAWVDLKDKIIPNNLILIGLGLWLIEVMIEVLFLQVNIKDVLLFSALGGGVWGGLLILIALVAKSALGMGDAKMFFVIGMIYGLNNTYSIMLVSLLIMAIVSIILLILKKVEKKTAVPMAPFALIGFILCIFLGM